MTSAPNPKQQQRPTVEPSVAEQGLGLFGAPEDAAFLDEVVRLAYAERRGSARFPQTERTDP